MNSLCVKCGICCKLMAVNWEDKVLLRDGIQPLDETFEENLLPLSKSDAQKINAFYVKNVQKVFPNAEFFSCKYLSDRNVCTCHPKPDMCRNFPSSPFAFLQENCGFMGEVFLKKEAVMQKVRKLKEEIIDYKAQISMTKDKKEKDHFRKIIIFHQKKIGKYKAYGAKNW